MPALGKLDYVSGVKTVVEQPLRRSLQPFEREVFGLLGAPVDVVDLEQVINRLERAKVQGAPFVLSTPNLNFLIQSRADDNFRETLLASDLCPADGTPIVWLSQLLGIPMKKRIPGSDIFDELKKRRGPSPMRVFFFGGAEGVAETVANRINAECPGMKCVGVISPGYGTVEQMSSQAVLDKINASGADFVAIFLNAKKGQEWMMRNARTLRAPLRAQLGATINFQAGTVRRAPTFLRAIGFEWLWRIKQEPFLWRRYFQDGISLIRMLATTVLPIVLLARLSRRTGEGVEVRIKYDGGNPTLHIVGSATLRNIARLQEAFSQSVTGETDVAVDLSGASDVDPRFFGLLIVARKILRERNHTLHLINASATIRRLFRLHGFTYLFAGAIYMPPADVPKV
jgi:N-acetylglucosaminyldiphosphoundecaprenol N-acetyl-beta-D-mannosaminyltransferase